MFYELPRKLRWDLYLAFLVSLAAFILCCCGVIEAGYYIAFQSPMFGFCIGVIFGVGAERYVWRFMCKKFGTEYVCKTLGPTKTKYFDVKGRKHYFSLITWLDNGEFHHIVADVDSRVTQPVRANAFVKAKVWKGHAVVLREETVSIDDCGVDYLSALDKAIAEIPEMTFD